MRGIHQVTVSSKRIRYSFTLRRNLTIIRSDSATGKTTLVDMIRQYINNPEGSAIDVQCDKNCYVLEGALWKSALAGVKDSIVFIDEGSSFVETEEFAETISQTDNYYVIVTRESLPMLPYSVEEIYGIHESGKYGSLKQTYNELYRVYPNYIYNEGSKTEKIVTENSNSGFQFFRYLCAEKNLKCASAAGKSNLFSFVSDETDNVLMIADGAAFGPEMDRIMKLLRNKSNVMLYLPESFEWLVLSSDLFENKELKSMLQNPSDYIESSQYFSWERYFTAYLVQISSGTYLRYNKSILNRNYLNKQIVNKILKIIPENII